MAERSTMLKGLSEKATDTDTDGDSGSKGFKKSDSKPKKKAVDEEDIPF